MDKKIELRDCAVAYEYFAGKQDITIILLHGYGLHGAMWMPQVELLQKKGYPIINIDIRGHGKSRPTKDFSVKLAAEDLQAVIDFEKLDRYLLCGLSMGAFVAQEHAFLFGGATGYLLTGVTPLFVPYAKWEKKLLALSGDIMKYCYTWKGLKRAMAKGSTHTRPAFNFIANMFEEMNKEEFLISWEGFTTCLHEENFNFKAPLLVLAGKEDTRGTIQKHLPDWNRYYPECTVKTIPEAGHVANLDQPEEFNRILLSFINFSQL